MLIAPRPSAHRIRKTSMGPRTYKVLGNAFKDAFWYSCALNIKPTTENETVWEQTKFGKPSEGASIHTSKVFHTLFLELVDL